MQSAAFHVAHARYRQVTLYTVHCMIRQQILLLSGNIMHVLLKHHWLVVCYLTATLCISHIHTDMVQLLPRGHLMQILLKQDFVFLVLSFIIQLSIYTTRCIHDQHVGHSPIHVWQWLTDDTMCLCHVYTCTTEWGNFQLCLFSVCLSKLNDNSTTVWPMMLKYK